jgi:hypothetical protein
MFETYHDSGYNIVERVVLMNKELEVSGLYKVIDLIKFRETPGVRFDILPKEVLDKSAGVDRVIHESYAQSPGPVGEVERPWYMHTHQGDHLMVLHGRRYVELYSIEHGKIESFTVEPNRIYKNGELLVDHPAILSWPKNVFHRIISKEEGSASINFAYRYEGLDPKTNFSIYSLNIEDQSYQVIRQGHKDQFIE